MRLKISSAAYIAYWSEISDAHFECDKTKSTKASYKNRAIKASFFKQSVNFLSHWPQRPSIEHEHRFVYHFNIEFS
jgi:hypothetical protein